MAKRLITPPEDVERAMESLFRAVESRDPSMKRFKDADFDRISQLLLQLGKPGWSERPRTYAILRVIGSTNSMDLFVSQGLLDITIPYTQSRIVSVLPRNVAFTFIEKQAMVMTETYDLEKAGGRHQHLDHDGDAHFSVVRVLGSGGYGEVDHVRSKLSLQDYARKRFRRSRILTIDQETINAFMRELTSLKKLKHHHVVTLLGSYTDQRYVGLIMKEIADCNLKEYLERTPFPRTEKQCLRGFYGSLISAVAYLHRSKVRHKDIKSSNILVKDQKLFVTDFCASYDWSDREKSTTMGRRGQYTPAYMAPEVEDWQPRNSSTDIYSLGLVFMDITTVLKGESFDTRVDHFKRNGTRTLFHRTNTVASKSWLQLLERKSSEDNQPLRWIREMTQERPQDRTTAEMLLRKILTYRDDHRYYSICCEDYDTVDDNMFYSGNRLDYHHVIQVNPDLNQGNLFSDSGLQPNQSENNSQSLVTAGSSRDHNTEKGKQFINAANDGNLLMIKSLLQMGADIETKDENGQTALMFAAQQGHLTLLKFLLDAGSNIECSRDDGWKPLHTAAYNGQLHEVKELIERHALIEAQTNDGQYPLHLACQRGHKEIVMLLLERGADIDCKTFWGWTALHFAAKHGYESIARLLLTVPQVLPGEVLECANIDATVDKGCNCLHIAADNGEPLLVELFLEMGIDVDTRTEVDWTPLHFAARSNHKVVALVLLSHGANMQAIANDGSMPLHMAARHGNDDIAAFLIEMGVKIEAVTADGMMTPLHCAASNGQLEMMRFLLKAGAKLTARTIVNCTALHLCCKGNSGTEKGRLACARFLLELGIDVNATDDDHLTPLHLAAFHGQDSLVELLLERGGDTHAEDNDTDTPLDCAIRKSHERIARLLIERGADIRRMSGRAMRIAVKVGHEGIARLLVRNGADTEGYEELLQILNLIDGRRDEYEAAKPSSKDLATITRNDDAVSSVGSVMSYDEEIFSQSGSVSSKSSAEPVYLSGIETVASLLIGDADLLPLYKEAMTKMNGERFVRNQRRLLKKYYINLRSEAQATLELEVIKILRSRHGRISIAQKVLRRLTSPQDYERARSQKISREYVLERHFLQATISTTNRRQDVIERPATPPKELVDENLLPTDGKDDLSYASESSENSDRSDDDEADKASYPVEHAKKFLVGGSPFELYKQSVRYFVQPPPSSGALEVSNRDIDAVETQNSNVLGLSMDGSITQVESSVVQFEPPPLAIVKQLQEVIATLIIITLWILIISDASLIRLEYSLQNSKFSPTFWFTEACKFWFGTSLLPPGVVRIKWMCKCGHISYDDMVEIRSGAVETLVQELRDTDGFRSIQTTNQAHGYFKTLKIICWNLGVSARNHLGRWTAGAKSTILPETETGNALASTNPPIVPLWLLFCVNGSKLATLQHLDLCTTKSDRELFTRLREMYSILRSEVVFVRRIFLQLGTIYFVQFQLLPKAFVDGFVIGHLPPPERDDYRYKAVECKPPVPPKWMMHVFNHPDFGSEITLCLERFPKRVKERLHWKSDEEVVGWGIYFAENLHVAMVLTAIFIFMLSVSIIFGICWSMLEHDISSAFTVAAWLTSIGALGLSTWSAWLTLVW